MEKSLKMVIGIVALIMILIGIAYFVSSYTPSAENPNIEIIDKTVGSDIVCAEALEKFYEDEQNEYYFPCIKSEYVVVKLKDGSEQGIVEALKNKVVTLADLDQYHISYYTEKKEDDKQAIYSHDGKGFSLILPKNWNFEILLASGDTEMGGIKFYPSNSEAYATLYDYTRNFGTCGTGLEVKEITLKNGNSAEVGYYDNNEQWSFACLEDHIVALNSGLKGEEAKTALEILKTIQYETDGKEINKNETKTFIGKVIEANGTNYLIEPNPEEEIRNSADKISINVGKGSDTLYAVGTIVKITYDGQIMETYPAQINVTNLEALNSNFDKEKDTFELTFEKFDKQGKQLLWEADGYNVYSFNGNVHIKINETYTTLKEALTQNRIAMEDIIAKANESMPKQEPYRVTYKDGGTIEYRYDEYTLIKCHRLDGNRDVYICDSETSLNDLGL